MAKKKVFVSFDYSNDRAYKNLLAAWDANTDFEFTFTDMSVAVAVNSTDAAAIKRVISGKLGGATHCLVLVGKDTHKSSWVAWEIEKACELKVKMVGVKIDKSYVSPSNLVGCGAAWAMSFTQDAVIKALNAA